MIINDELKRDIIKQHNDGKSIKFITKDLNVTRYSVCKILDINTSHKFRNRICPVCGKEFSTNFNKIVCSKECRTQYRKDYMKNLNYCYDKVKDWRLRNKKLAIEYKGGKCIVCSYKKCSSALEFHHLIPSEKDFNISRNKSINFEKMKLELQKCVLVCCNCHREIHDGVIEINSYLINDVNNESVS